MGSSLPNHEAKVGIGTDRKETKKRNKENPRADNIRHS